MPPPRWPASLLLASALAAIPAPARANMARAVFDGDRHGVLVPSGATAVRVDRESLAFALTRDLATAAVTASYRLTNTSGIGESGDVAFAFVRGDDDKDPGAAIEADGAPIPFRAATDGEILGPQLGAWLAEHAEIARELRTPGGCADPAKLRALVEAAGGRCERECTHLATWQMSLAKDAAGGDKADRKDPPTTADDTRNEIVYQAAREAIPSTVEDLVERWSALHEHRRLGFLIFHLDFQPHQSRSVAVHYDHHAALDRRAHVNETYGFDYLLSPAKRWAGFGPLDITVRVPGHARFASRLPFTRDGDTYRADLPALPGGELRFDVMSLSGLWFGLAESNGYWAMFIAAIAAVAVAIGAAVGRTWANTTGAKRVLLPIFAAAPLVAACNLAVLVLLLAAFPHYALGFGYGALIGGGFLVLLSAPVGAVASSVSADRGARPPREETPRVLPSPPA